MLRKRKQFERGYLIKGYGKRREVGKNQKGKEPGWEETRVKSLTEGKGNFY